MDPAFDPFGYSLNAPLPLTAAPEQRALMLFFYLGAARMGLGELYEVLCRTDFAAADRARIAAQRLGELTPFVVALVKLGRYRGDELDAILKGTLFP